MNLLEMSGLDYEEVKAVEIKALSILVGDEDAEEDVNLIWTFDITKNPKRYLKIYEKITQDMETGYIENGTDILYDAEYLESLAQMRRIRDEIEPILDQIESGI